MTSGVKLSTRAYTVSTKPATLSVSWQHVNGTVNDALSWQDNPGYDELFKFYLDNKYQLRYTGGMVPDVNQVKAIIKIDKQNIGMDFFSSIYIFNPRR